jgi:NAD(P)-dependent dehydrogenase (short-subunit alcohol dehydrogenase family)
MAADLGFDGRVALITGAGGGLGRSHALLLANRGAMVVVNDIGGSVHGEGSSASPADMVVAEIEKNGGVAVANADSVATVEGGQAMVDCAVEHFGRIDIVVNNAGILRDKSFASMTPELVDPVLDVHLRGAFNVTQPAWLHMKEQGYGRIVSTTSASGILGNFGQANYGAAKMGIWGLTRVLAQEGERYGIRANAIAPVAFTRMTDEILASMEDKLQPETVSPVVAWLAHEDCPVSGEAFSCAGGRVARFFVGLTQGWFDPDLTVEGVRDNFDQIRSTEGYWEPESLTAEVLHLAELFGIDAPKR